MKECKEAYQCICDYIDGELDHEYAARLEEHINECRQCQKVLEDLKKLKTACREQKEIRMPDEMKKRLKSIINEKINTKE